MDSSLQPRPGLKRVLKFHRGCFRGGGADGVVEMYACGHAEDMSFERHGGGVDHS